MNKMLAIGFIAMVAGAAQGADLARWTFESSIPDTAGPYAAEAGVNAITSAASGFHTSGAVVYSNPVGNGSGESFSSNNWSAGDYYQFRTSTLSYNAITVSWAQISSSTGPTSFALQWSSDGSSFSTIQNYTVGISPSWSSGSSSAAAIFAPVALPAGAANLANVWIRLTSLITPSNTAGTSRVDDVVIGGTLVPTPGSIALFGLAGLTAARRRRA